MNTAVCDAVWAAEFHPPMMKLFALCLAARADSATGVTTASLGVLAKDCNISRTHAKRLLRELIQQDVIEVVSASAGGRRTDTNAYQFNPARLRAGPIQPGATAPVSVSFVATRNLSATGTEGRLQ